MKKLFVGGVISSFLLGTSSYAGVGYRILDEQFKEREGMLGMPYKDLHKDSRYSGRSEIYGGVRYPKVPMIHTYHQNPVFSPLSVIFSKAHLPKKIRKEIENEFPNADVNFAFVVQALEKEEPLAPDERQAITAQKEGKPLNPKQNEILEKLKTSTLVEQENGEIHYINNIKDIKNVNNVCIIPKYSLKTHYWADPNSPTHSDKTTKYKVNWVASLLSGRDLTLSHTYKGTDEAILHPRGKSLRPKFPWVKVEDIKSIEKRQRAEQGIKNGAFKTDSQGRVNMDDVEGIPIDQRFSTLVEKRNIPIDANGMVDMNDLLPELQQEDPRQIILSPDNMHLKGLTPFKDSALGSTVSIVDEEQPRIIHTLHWLLTEKSLEVFNEALSKANNLRSLLQNLNNIDKDGSFAPLIKVLRRASYIDQVSYKTEIPEEVREYVYNTIPILREKGNKVSDEGLVKYLFEQRGYGKQWEALGANGQKEFIDRLPIKISFLKFKRSVPKEVLENLPLTVHMLREKKNQAPYEELISYLLKGEHREQWKNLDPRGKAKIIASIDEYLKKEYHRALSKFEKEVPKEVLTNLPSTVQGLRKIGNKTSLAEIVKYLLDQKGYAKSWNILGIGGQNLFLGKIDEEVSNITASLPKLPPPQSLDIPRLTPHLSLNFFQQNQKAGQAALEQNRVYLNEFKRGYDNRDTEHKPVRCTYNGQEYDLYIYTTGGKHFESFDKVIEALRNREVYVQRFNEHIISNNGDTYIAQYDIVDARESHKDIKHPLLRINLVWPKESPQQ